MLKPDQLKQIAALLRTDETTLSAALQSPEPADLDLPEGLTTLTASELQTRDKRIKSTGYNEGKIAGIEMWVDEKKQELGLNFEGKDANKLVSELEAKTLHNANIKPNDALREKEEHITRLKTSIANLEKTIADKDSEVKHVSLRSKLLTGIPADMPVDEDEFIESMQRRGYSFEESENGILVKKAGNIITKGNALEPAAWKDIMHQYAKDERGWLQEEELPQPSGRGAGSDKIPNAGRKIFSGKSEVEVAWTKDGKKLTDPGYAAFYIQAKKDNPDLNVLE